MPKFVSDELTEDLYRRLCGRFVDEYAGKVILVHSVDPNGWSHPSVLSYFEVAAKDRRNVRLATYNTSNTTENMRRTGKVTLSIFDERVTYYIKGTVTVLLSQMKSAAHNSKLNVQVDQVLVDHADPVLEPEAYISSGITYVSPNSETLRQRNSVILKELLE